MDDQKRRDDGMAQRRKVLGDAWVDKSIANKNSFNADFQDLITRYAWSEIWTRPHFDQRTRRVLVIAGRHDMATPVAAGEFIRSQIPGASLTILDAAHISNVEQPHAFTDAVVGFLMQR